jgi:drug/metabolite transporter (DMT)-like permease
MALLGTWLAAAPKGGHAGRAGVLLAVLAGLWYATFLLGLDRITPGVPAFVSSACIIAGAAAAFVVALPFAGGYRPPATPLAWGAILGMIGGPTILGFLMFVAGLKRTGPQVAAILSTFEPLGTLILAVLLLGERLRPGQWIGAALILAAAIVLAAGTIDRTAATA